MGRDITAAEFERLYQQTVRDVFTFVRRRTAADAENLVAEVFAVAWRRRWDMPPALLRRAWLFGVARTLLKEEWRRQQREDDLVADLGAYPTPTEPTDNGTVELVLAAALDRLPPVEREALRLVVWECLTPAETAVALGVRPGTARVRLHRARQRIAADPEVRALLERTDSSILR